jgi:iron complex outermembrane receptor protein
MLKSSNSALHQKIIGLLVGASVLSLASAASAQSAGTQPAAQGELEIVIVTANKVAEPVQKVAQTVNVVSSETISDH